MTPVKKEQDQDKYSLEPRHGLRRVRTGCVTCRVRKVKCDEEQPHCRRCRSTGRKCDGYPPWVDVTAPTIKVSQSRPSSFPGLETDSMGSLEFFIHVVSPVLSTPVSREFSIHQIVPLISREPVIMHAVITLSAVYERISKDSTRTRYQSSDKFVIRHHNRAIKTMIGFRSPDPDQINAILIATFLLMAIDYLRGSTETAAIHIKHGICISNACCPNGRLVALFRRLSVLPLFTDRHHSDLPLLVDSHEGKAASNPSWTPACSFTQTQAWFDRLEYHCVRLTRFRDNHQSTPTSANYPLHIQQERNLFEQELDKWWLAFSALKANEGVSHQYTAISKILEMRWLVSKIWASCCLEREMMYDEHLPRFQRIIAIANQLRPARDLFQPQARQYVFELGFAPVLLFVVAKCRYLPLRLTALSLMREKRCEREIMWDAHAMYRLGCRMVELEHQICFGEFSTPVRQTEGTWPLFPEDCDRLRDFRVPNV